MLNFYFLGEGLEIVSSLYFVYEFSRKMFHLLDSTNGLNLIVWLPLLLEILDNMCIPIVCFPSYEVINFEIALISI